MGMTNGALPLRGPAENESKSGDQSNRKKKKKRKNLVALDQQVDWYISA